MPLAPERDLEYVAPRTDLEQTISMVWQEVLKRDTVGVHDNFFDLGGTSLLVPQVVSKLNDRLGKRLKALTIFQHPSISSLAQALSEGSAAPAGSAYPADQAKAVRASRARQGERRRKVTRNFERS
jgi:Phosphopantetheine attachment site